MVPLCDRVSHLLGNGDMATSCVVPWLGVDASHGSGDTSPGRASRQSCCLQTPRAHEGARRLPGKELTRPRRAQQLGLEGCYGTVPCLPPPWGAASLGLILHRGDVRMLGCHVREKERDLLNTCIPKGSGNHSSAVLRAFARWLSSPDPDCELWVAGNRTRKAGALSFPDKLCCVGFCPGPG